MEMNTVKKTLSIFDEIKDVDDTVMMLSIIGTVIDTWAHDRGMSVEEADKLFDDLTRVAKVKHDKHGLIIE